MSRAYFGAAAAAALLTTLPQQASAFEFTPMVAQFAPSGPAAARSFVLRNTQEGVVAVQIQAVTRSVAEDGEEVRSPEDDDFLITPPQIVLAPGQSQNVRVQWLGDSAPERELAYRFLVTQVPITYQDKDLDAGAATAKVAIGYNYEAAIYVTPPGAKPSAQVASAEPVTDAQGAKVLRLQLASTGGTRAILQQPALQVRGGGASVTLDRTRLKALDTINLLAGTTRVVDLPWPEEVPFGPVEVQLSASYLTLD